MSEFSHEEKLVIYVTGLCLELKGRGLIEGDGVSLSDEGIKIFQELKASGFNPTAEEIKSVMSAIQVQGGE